ncbi:RNA-binding protein 1-like isoform X2 [Colias croceus]|uniref:RNA-binding protein 1-like isoform X2 n=1 Tax=Colias crocea TaxID=72248 RepID=UPI001E27B28C|nr:RNA-binding protein 1-like isoform X2 [Colias croceus]
MSRYREWDLSCKVYVGNLGTNASKYEIEKVFSKYGSIRNVWVARNPPGFAFVEFEDPRDAEDSVRGLDGTRCCGTRIRVEMSNGRTRRDRSRSPRRRSYSRGRSGSPRRSPSVRRRSPSVRRSRSRDRRSRSDSKSRYNRTEKSPYRRSASPRRSRSFERSRSNSRNRYVRVRRV